jgi:hypothetical protein
VQAEQALGQLSRRRPLLGRGVAFQGKGFVTLGNLFLRLSHCEALVRGFGKDIGRGGVRLFGRSSLGRHLFGGHCFGRGLFSSESSDGPGRSLLSRGGECGEGVMRSFLRRESLIHPGFGSFFGLRRRLFGGGLFSGGLFSFVQLAPLRRGRLGRRSVRALRGRERIFTRCPGVGRFRGFRCRLFDGFRDRCFFRLRRGSFFRLRRGTGEELPCWLFSRLDGWLWRGFRRGLGPLFGRGLFVGREWHPRAALLPAPTRRQEPPPPRSRRSRPR